MAPPCRISIKPSLLASFQDSGVFNIRFICCSRPRIVARSIIPTLLVGSVLETAVGTIQSPPTPAPSIWQFSLSFLLPPLPLYFSRSNLYYHGALFFSDKSIEGSTRTSNRSSPFACTTSTSRTPHRSHGLHVRSLFLRYGCRSGPSFLFTMDT